MWDYQDYLLLKALFHKREKGKNEVELHEVFHWFDAIDRSYPPILYLNIAIKNFEEQQIFLFDENTFSLTETGFKKIKEAFIVTESKDNSLSNRATILERRKAFMEYLDKNGIKTTSASIPKSDKITLALYENEMQIYHSKFKEMLNEIKEKQQKEKESGAVKKFLHWIVSKL